MALKPRIEKQLGPIKEANWRKAHYRYGRVYSNHQRSLSTAECLQLYYWKERGFNSRSHMIEVVHVHAHFKNRMCG